ncbi:MAG TPA: helix-turn-helix domain-containing protein [Phytomonospora sp.]
MDAGKQVMEWASPLVSGASHADCPARRVLDNVTSRWGVWVLIALRSGGMRFHELRDEIPGVSEKMLSSTLRALVRDGLLWREVEPTTPPKVTYGLTPLGAGTAAPLSEMFAWLRDNALDIRATQEKYDKAG